MNIQEQIAANRDFCKSPFAKERELSDQQKRLPQPPLCKPAQSERRILLGRDFRSVMTQTDFFTILQKRTSQRFYRDEEMSLEQLSFLLWATQGVKSIRGDHYATLRTVPSGGARHAFETYLAVRKVAGLSAGVYHYLPLENRLRLRCTGKNGRAAVQLPFYTALFPTVQNGDTAPAPTGWP